METSLIFPNTKARPMVPPEIRKQISMFLPVSDWRALRQEAARLNIPITELCRQWIGPEIRRLKQNPGVPPGSDH